MNLNSIHQRTRRKIFWMTLALGLAIPCLMLSCLLFGSVHIPVREVLHILSGGVSESSSWNTIILESRLPQAITALLAGAALAAGGLLLQTMFQNPLAEPSILGISSGANLGVAIVILFLGGTLGSFASFSLFGHLAVVLGAFIGAIVVLALIVWFSLKIQSNSMLLIIGIMIGFFTSGIIFILNFYASVDNIHLFVLWSMGDFSAVGLKQLPFFSITVGLGLITSLLLIKPLNALLLGEKYAANLGVSVTRARVLILLSTGLLTAAVTAFCGPVSFIGMAVPHIARLLSGSSNHKILLPLTLLTGSCMALLCNLLSILPGNSGMLPLNAITPLLGAPVIIYVILNKRKIQYFN